MKANELRIGNLVYFLGNVHEIEGLSKRLRPDVGHFLLSNIEHAQKGFHLKPIPLTEEWLIKFGFDEIKYNGCDILKLKDQSTGKHISFVFYNEELYTSFDTEPAFEPIKYVHQLQNLYFALTGEELTIG